MALFNIYISLEWIRFLKKNFIELMIWRLKIGSLKMWFPFITHWYVYVEYERVWERDRQTDRERETDFPLAEYVWESLKLYLECNNFVFNEKYYLQLYT